MNSFAALPARRTRVALVLLLASFLAGCATQRIDWAARIGVYAYDQAVVDLGPPDRQAKLQDGTQVVEWLTSRGYGYAYPAFGFGYGYGFRHYPYWYPGPYYPGFVEFPDYFLRLVFGPDGKLKAWKKFAR